MLYLIKMADTVAELTGVGEEYLKDKNGNIIAKFMDGVLTNGAMPMGNSDITKVPSEVA